MSEQEMLSIASKFSPYRCVDLRVPGALQLAICSVLLHIKLILCRSLFMWYMWRIADVDTEVLE